jgi:hypothetical protein
MKNAVIMAVSAGGKIFSMLLGLILRAPAMHAQLILFDHAGMGKRLAG